MREELKRQQASAQGIKSATIATEAAKRMMSDIITKHKLTDTEIQEIDKCMKQNAMQWTSEGVGT